MAGSLDKEKTPQGERLDALFARAQALQEQDRYLQALRIYRKIVEKDPGRLEAWIKIGSIQGGWREYEPALRAFTIAVEISPDYAYAWNGQGQCLLGLGRYESARQAYQTAVELEEENDDALDGMAETLFHLGRLDEALRASRSAVLINPHMAYYQFNLGRIHNARGEFASARDTLTKALELDSENPRVYYELGVSLLELGENEKAVSAFQAAAERHPRYGPARSELGYLYLAKAQWEAARAQFEIVARLYPAYAPPWPGLAGIHLEASEIAECEACLARFYKLARPEELKRFGPFLLNLLETRVRAPLLYYRILQEQPQLVPEGSEAKLKQTAPEKIGTSLRRIIQELENFSAEPEQKLSLEGILYYYGGDSLIAARRFETLTTLNPDSLRAWYYRLLSETGFAWEDRETIGQALKLARKISNKPVAALTPGMIRQFYYAGLILHEYGFDARARGCFLRAGDFLPARYMRAYLSSRLSVEQSAQLQSEVSEQEREFQTILAIEQKQAPANIGDTAESSEPVRGFLSGTPELVISPPLPIDLEERLLERVYGVEIAGALESFYDWLENSILIDELPENMRRETNNILDENMQAADLWRVE